MAGETSSLHMVQMKLDVARLVDLGIERGLPPHTSDWGYLVHCLLGELFGDSAPAPFVILSGDSQQRGALEVLGYSALADEALREHAQSFAAPLVHAGCDWKRFASKPLPETWRPGARYGFRLRACPTVRLSHHPERPQERGPEVDAFLARCWQVGEAAVDRESVYREWLGRELERHGAATLRQARLQGFKRLKVLRRTQGDKRTGRTQERPEAWLEGTLEVGEPEAFLALLRRGVGRHRAFGFGMVLLRPAREAAC